MLPSIRVVIVNWNSGELLSRCLVSIDSVQRNDFLVESVVIVDNSSTDGSADNLKLENHKLILISNDNNSGFGAACNQGAMGSRTEYLLFLNPDARLFPKSLDVSIQFMEHPRNSRIGICGVQLVNDQNCISHSCARFPEATHFLSAMFGLNRIAPHRFPSVALVEWDHAEARAVDHVIGAFLDRKSVV